MDRFNDSSGQINVWAYASQMAAKPGSKSGLGRPQARLINDQQTHGEPSQKEMDKRDEWPQNDINMGLGWGWAERRCDIRKRAGQNRAKRLRTVEGSHDTTPKL